MYNAIAQPQHWGPNRRAQCLELPTDAGVAVRRRAVNPHSNAVTVAVEGSRAYLRDVAQRMFERFRRADTSRTDDGFGLGQAIGHGLIEAQGGRIWGENHPTGGARLAFALAVAGAHSLADPGVA